MPGPVLNIKGFAVHKGLLEPDAQRALVADLRAVAVQAPFFTPVTKGGKPMSVRMTSAGRVGWVSDRKGYRYEPCHPSGVDWPEIPESVLELWKAVSGVARAPDCCLINYYGEDTRMGMHRDLDEGDFSWPVVSVSLGDDALFRMGNRKAGGSTESVWLSSGDVVVMAGAARTAFHGIDRLRFGSSSLLPKGGRINITLRVVVDKAD